MTVTQPISVPGCRLGIITLGCKVNQCESAFLAEKAIHQGCTLAPLQDADVLLVNTCTVTSRTDRQVRQILRQAARRQSLRGIILTGCYAQRAPQELAPFPKVQAVLGNCEKALFPDLLPSLLDNDEPLIRVGDINAIKKFSSMPLQHFWGHTRAFVKVQDGCGHCCSYCIVPQVRGPERSLPLEELLGQLETLIAGGCKEIVLTGINLSRYGQDLPEKHSLLALVRRLKLTSWPVRFRLSSIEPHELSLELLQELASWPQFCPHFHIPLQSGAAKILAAMHRPYQPDWFAGLVRQISAIFPAAPVGLDVMVGFPTESASDFNQTMELVERLPVAYLHVFPYSARPGTPAAGLPPLADGKEIHRRAKELRTLGLRKKAEFYRSQVGQIAEVLVETDVAGRPGWVTGLTANYLRVQLPGPLAWANHCIRVRLKKMDGQILIGEVIT